MSIIETLEKTSAVKPLKIDGEPLPMHSTYAFELKKVYVEDPKRTNTGSIPVFPDKFFVPYFTVTWAVLSIDNYHKIMRLIERDENRVEYYDQNEGVYKISKFYAQQPTYNKLYSMEKKYNMVLNLQIVFAGTLNDIEDITIEYNANGGMGTITSQTGTNGEEYVSNSGATISRLNYKLDSWNTEPDGTGESIPLSSIQVYKNNMTLYAHWVEVDSYTLSLSYNYGTPAKDSEGNDIENISVRYEVPIQGLPENVIVLDPNSEIEEELIDKYGDKVFTFDGWNKLSQSVGVGSWLNNGEAYDIKGSSIAYAHFIIKEYTLTFLDPDNSDAELASPITAEYLSKVSLPKPKKENYTFSHWYYIDEKGNEVTYARTIMPYENITLYAKWEAISE